MLSTILVASSGKFLQSLSDVSFRASTLPALPDITFPASLSCTDACFPMVLPLTLWGASFPSFVALSRPLFYLPSQSRGDICGPCQSSCSSLHSPHPFSFIEAFSTIITCFLVSSIPGLALDDFNIHVDDPASVCRPNLHRALCYALGLIIANVFTFSTSILFNTLTFLFHAFYHST